MRKETSVKRGSLFIGKHVELMRPVNQVDENLMRRIAEAKQRLIEKNIEPVALVRAKPLPDIKRLGSIRRQVSGRFNAPVVAATPRQGS